MNTYPHKAEDDACSSEEAELQAAIEAVLSSPSDKKLVIAGPGAGKTTLFKRLLKRTPGDPDQRIVLTFINNLKDDLEEDLSGLARVFTLHSFCMGILHRNSSIRGSLSGDFRCQPGLATLIADDWELINDSNSPPFVGQMRALSDENEVPFYLRRGEYYDAVDFDDSVYRVLLGFSAGQGVAENYELVLIDEYQDFNTLEAAIIDFLADQNPILIAGDDDQALYSQLRGASWEHIRRLSRADEYEVFMLPFCMRCPEVIVDAVNDVLAKAADLKKLSGRIDKPFKHFPPAKGADSAKYPKITKVETSVQRSGMANYMGKYLAQAIKEIPAEEADAAVKCGYPVALVIAAKPYRGQIVSYLENEGLDVRTGRDSGDSLSRDEGLSILKEDLASNLGWRIVLANDQPSFLADAVRATAGGSVPLIEVLPGDYRDSVIAEIEAFEPTEVSSEEAATATSVDAPSILVTSFEGAKGLSAQHVFLAGLHDGELPNNPNSIKDLEICKFLVGLTRTRKKCTLIHTRRFAGVHPKTVSRFVSWINPRRMEFIRVDAGYWKKASQS